MKPKRFVSEYANYLLSNLRCSNAIKCPEQAEKAEKIKRVLFCYENALISATEAIRALLETV